MNRVVLVGDIGSGKTYISKLFNYPIFNADEEVSKIYKVDLNCFKKLKKSMPFYFTNFPIKKEKLISAVMANDENIKKISRIIHPIVRKRLQIFINKNKKKKIVILDIPLFFENKLQKKNDIIIFVKSNKNEINSRLKKRINYNPKLLQKLRSLQYSTEIKKQNSNLIIKNDFKKSKVKKKVLEILKKIA